MKIYGYSKSHDDLLEMTEISVMANATQLRNLAEFITRAADRLELSENSDSHIHFKDFEKAGDTNCADVIIIFEPR